MIVPTYWAEAKIRDKVNGHQVTLRRFGWSDTSQEAAQQHANQRVAEAMDRLRHGERVDRREYKQAYNGASGVPIREEILSRHGDVVITRNSYGAHCLNTPDVLFADVDVEDSDSGTGCLIAVVALVIGVGAGWRSGGSFWIGLLAGVGAAIVASGVWTLIWGMVHRPEATANRARRRVEHFARTHPDWHLRLYRTPAGWRVLAMHRTFAPDDPEVGQFFDALGTDRVYVRMCQNQKCFRARVSPKPWRIGIPDHMRPRPGVWPVAPERMERRTRWVNAYEKRAVGFASCRFVAALGSQSTHPQALAVQELHDHLGRAQTDLPLA